MPKRTLTAEEKEHIVCIYSAEKATQSDLAIHYGVGRTTIRRVLADAGLAVFNEHATPKERNLLEVLKTFSIESADQLSRVLQRGLSC